MNGFCDDCLVNFSDLVKGSGIFYREICHSCRFKEAISKPLIQNTVEVESS